MRGKILASGAMALSVALTGCFGDSDGTDSGEAYFVDNAVIGLGYTCDNSDNLKYTGEQGLVLCGVGETVRFFVGDIELGSTTMPSETVVITPLDLAPADDEELSETVVVNIARFLMSLDADQDLSNGIQIDSASHQDLAESVDFEAGEEDFEDAMEVVLAALTSDLPDGPFELVGTDDAADHVTLGMLFAHAGYYEGTIDRGNGETSTLAFIMSREGYAYGTNLSGDGIYADAAMDEMNNGVDIYGQIEGFKLDGGSFLAPIEEGPQLRMADVDATSGATVYADAYSSGGTIEGGDDQQTVSFTTTRELLFSPVIDEDLVNAVYAMTPLAINLSGEAFASDGQDDLVMRVAEEEIVLIEEIEEETPFVIGSGSLRGTPFGTFDGGTPDSAMPENHSQYWYINFAEVVSAEDDVVRLLAMSISGYLLDVVIDFSGDSPVVDTQWRHIHEGTSGESAAFMANYDGGLIFDDIPIIVDGPIPMTRDAQKGVTARW